MRRFRNLRTMTKILSIVVTMTVLMLIIAYTGYSTSDRIAVRMQDMYVNYAKVSLNMTKAAVLAAENRSFIMSMLDADSGKELESYESRVMENREAIARLIGTLDEERLTQEARNLHGRLKETGPKYRKLQDEAIAIAKSKAGIEELRDRLSSRGDIGFMENEYVASINSLADDLVKLADETNGRAHAFARSRGEAIALTSLAAVAIGFCLSIVISRTITSPIYGIMNSIGLFSKGDLVSRFPAEGKDELALMGGALQDMTDNLRQVIGAVKDASADILETSREFSALAQQTSASLDGFRANIDDTGSNLSALAATGEEVNASVEEVAAGAQATAEKGTGIAKRVDDAMSAGEGGMSSVRRAVSGIERVVGNAAAAARSVQELGERTRQIQNFVAQIGGIADQTNLLALNAAIEAARAGDAGRGFAVVAEEVRKLAEESNLAAKSIEDLAKTIMGDLETVVKMSLENAKASEDARALSKETESIISDMISYLKDIAGATQDLAAVSEEQAASSEEIAEAVQSISIKVSSSAEAGEHIRAGVEGVAAATERIAKGAEGLSKLSGHLENGLSFFKTEDPVSGSTGTGKLALKG
jgi:methyl-accepting chemotaxis protein